MKFIPVLYPADATDFSMGGLGRLTELTACTITQEMNADTYELQATYPVSGRLYEEIKVDRIITAYVRKISDPETSRIPQPFRIYSTSTDLSTGLMTINATHVCLHCMHNLVCCPGNISGTLAEILQAIVDTAILPEGETLPIDLGQFSDLEISIDFSVPVSLYDVFYDETEGILSNYGLVLEFNQFSAVVTDLVTEPSGVTIRQGSNMSKLTIVSDASEVVTGLVPYYATEDDDGIITTIYAEPKVITLDEKEVCYDHLLPYDCTSEIEKPDWAGDEWVPDPQDIYEWAMEYLDKNYDGYIPTTYASGLVTASDVISADVNIGMIVAVLSKTLKTRVYARITGLDYNCLTDEYESVSIGTVRSNLANTICDMTNEKKKVEKVSTTGRHGTVGDFSWTVNKAGNICDMVIRHSIACSSVTSKTVTLSVPEEAQELMGWTTEGYDTAFYSTTDVSGSVVYTRGTTYITMTVTAAKRCNLTGTIYVHIRMNSGTFDDTNYVSPTDTTGSYSKNQYWYADCLGKNAKLYAYKSKAYQCYGNCSSMYASVMNMGTYYRAGFCREGNNTTAIDTLPETAAEGKWVAEINTGIYVESTRKSKIGTIPKGTVCRCLASLGNSFLLCWPVSGTEYHRVGFVLSSGGLLDDTEE